MPWACYPESSVPKIFTPGQLKVCALGTELRRYMSDFTNLSAGVLRVCRKQAGLPHLMMI